MATDRTPRRLWHGRLPHDPAAERGAIGALLIAPRVHAVKLARRAWKDHFYDTKRGWLWSRLTYALTQSKLDFDQPGVIRQWLEREQIWREAREVMACLNAGFWWHGNWYIDRVLESARLRGRIENAAKQLEDAIAAGDNWK